MLNLAVFTFKVKYLESQNLTLFSHQAAAAKNFLISSKNQQKEGKILDNGGENFLPGSLQFHFEQQKIFLKSLY